MQTGLFLALATGAGLGVRLLTPEPGWPAWLNNLAVYFLAITLEAAPFLLLGALLSALVEDLLPPDLLPRLTARLGVWGVPAAALLSPLLPVCECGVLVVARGLMRRGLPLPHALTYTLAAPILNPAVFLSTWLAFRDPTYALVRMAGGFAVAVAVGLVLRRVDPARAFLPEPRPPAAGPAPILEQAPGGHGPACACGCAGHAPGLEQGRLGRVLGRMGDGFLETMPYFLTGVLLASAMKTFLAGPVLDGLGRGELSGPLTMMAAAFVFSLCSEADAFAAAGFTEFSFAAQMAFLLLGPVLDIKLLLMYRTMFRGRFLLLLSLGLVAAVGLVTALLGLLARAGWPS